LTAPVSPDKGLPHFRDITLSDIRAMGVGTAFSVNAAPEAPLTGFHVKNIQIEAKHAGEISHTRVWTFQNVSVEAQDKLPLRLVDMEQSRGAIKQQR
jgi:hypothetical protein